MEILSWWGLAGPVVMFALTMSATPGPNNMMLTASGAQYGFYRTLPHMLGISIGFMVLMVAVALGLGSLFQQWPILQQGLKVIGSAYLLWLAWKIAKAPAPELAVSTEEGVSGRPFSFWQALSFQFVNPKCWVMAISAIASFTWTGDEFWLSAAFVTVLCGLTNLPSIAMWAGFGVAIGRLLKKAWHWRCFNGVMGAMTAACVLLILS
ncbi:lysine transporter LysE [Terasakiispira papahanaumokuakeensis]|uniref:Lysine transporter LysE n=1 Tax=Terasakiispira papahanaumokuakeensis TaxID=197479 RepID=A0A1E2VF50_9GAMM|nr:LysE family translocator [Terasakiispira papahanaumokuakeensis]ODC05472.1 lysine transporter LysE [Terasakiispira papahanaumokuakeensis]